MDLIFITNAHHSSSNDEPTALGQQPKCDKVQHFLDLPLNTGGSITRHSVAEGKDQRLTHPEKQGKGESSVV